MSYDWRTAFGYWGDLIHAALTTLQVTVLAFLVAFALGLLAASARLSRLWLLRFVAGVYIEVIRNTPVLVQIFVAYFALPSLGLHLTAFQAGVLALGVNVGAYLAEIFRAGLRSVPEGQREAARVLALGRGAVFAHVVLPQALRNVYPAVVNQFIQILLGTSLLSTIALPELTGRATEINSDTLLSVQIFTMAVIIYLVLSNAASLLFGLIGRFAFKPAVRLTRTPTRLRVRRAISLRPSGGQ